MNDKLFRFKIDGEFIDVLDRAGQAPDEYMGLNNFFLDHNGRVYINCKTGARIKVYDNTFKYIGEINYPEGVKDAESYWFINKIYLFPESISESPKYDWVVIDSSGKLLHKKANPSYGKITHFTSNHSLILFGNNEEFYRYREIEDTIYAFSEDSQYPKFIVQREFKDGYRMYSKEELTKPIQSIKELNFLLMMKGIRSIQNIIDIGDYWIIGYKDTKYLTVLFEKENNTLFPSYEGSNPFTLTNDLLGAGEIPVCSVALINDKIYLLSYIEALNLKRLVLSNIFRESEPKSDISKERISAIANDLKDDDNPVLIQIELR